MVLVGSVLVQWVLSSSGGILEFSLWVSLRVWWVLVGDGFWLDTLGSGWF
jgi:hypothetical protein